jgi:hypothetical protein
VLAQAAPPFIGPAVQWYSLAPLITLVGGGLVLMVLSAPSSGDGPAAATRSSPPSSPASRDVHHPAVERRGQRAQEPGPGPSARRLSLFLTFVICAAVFISALFLDDYLRVELDGQRSTLMLMPPRAA